MYLQSNFWLTNILLPWTYLNRFFCDCAPHEPYHVLPEWSPHRRTLMAWPERISVDQDDQLQHARTEVAAIAQTIAKYEPVWLYVSPGSEDSATPWVASANITIKVANLEQPWMRDTGPLFAESADGKLVGVDLNYKYTGSKASFSKGYDKTLTARILARHRIDRGNFNPAIHLSDLEFDENGTLLAPESSIVYASQEANAVVGEIARQFFDLLGAEHIVWLPSEKTTSTGASIVARFAPDTTVLLSRPNAAVPSSDRSWRIYKSTKESLQSSTNADSQPFRIIEIEEAGTVPYARVQAPSDQRPATSYLGHYLPNGAVLIPQFGDEQTDGEAVKTLASVWPDREAVGVQVDMLAWMGGSIRAATVPWPRLEAEGDADGGRKGEFREDEL